MAELNMNASTTTGLTGAVDNYSVASQTLDQASQNDTYYDYPDAKQQLGYYKTIPELKKAIDALATWAVGKGFTTTIKTLSTFDFVNGWGEDSPSSIFWNLIVQKKVFGDAFAEIIRDEKGGLNNIKPLFTGDMRVIVGENGIIKGYEQRTNNNGEPIKFKPREILHLVNDRVGNEIHGVSVIDACKWVIDARNEALTDYRKIRHRQLAMGVLYVDSDNQTKINSITSQYQDAVNKGEVLVLPKDVASLEDGSKTTDNPIQWITYLENFFYQAVGIPRVIATSENFTEASSKVGYLTFEPIYTREQVDLEADLLSQVGIRLKFNRPPSLSGMMQDSEEKNTGQTGFQPSEVKASVTRNE